MKGKRTVLFLGLAIPILLGVLFGSGVYTFFSAHGTSYLSNDPAVCTNCHVMRENYDGWLHGSHHAVATCNDCHLPHDNAVHKLYVKVNGFNIRGSPFALYGVQALGDSSWAAGWWRIFKLITHR